ncbi:flippase [Geomonas azotofigens]|uniref:flippase n=1 Tax=Geomonas azotofigens TaxID=2843196 RepID=UPI001C125B0E|nr:flippase [Geomonas azotofigens]MBU5613392.1 flippase [Geomonas azotofigens]
MSSLSRNSLFSTLSLLLKFGTNAGLSIVLARILGAAEFGRFVFVATFTGIFAVIVDYSFHVQVVREVARAPESVRTTVQRMLSAKLLLALFCTVLVAATAASSQPPGIAAAVVVLWAGALFCSLGQFLNNAFRGIGRFELETYPMLFLNALLILFVVALLVFVRDLVLVAAAYTAARLLYFLVSYRNFRRLFGKLSFRFGFREEIKTLHELFPFALYSILAVVYLQMDTVILSYLKDDAQVGHYQAAMRVAFGATIIPEILVASFLPLLAKAIRSDAGHFRCQALLLNKCLLVSGAAIASFLAVFAGPVVQVIYGSGYAPAALLLKLLALLVFLRFAGAGFEMMLNISSNKRGPALCVSLPAAFNVAVNLWAIPRFGAVGAACTSIVTHLVVGSLYALFVYRSVHGIFIGRLCVRGMLLSVFAGILALFMNQFGPAWGVLAFLALPTLLARFALDSTELAAVYRLLNRTFPTSQRV